MADIDAASLAERLAGSFNATAAREFDGTVLLELRSAENSAVERIVLRIDHGELETRVTRESVSADITLYFHSSEEAAALLLGTANPVTSFMDGRFRSDGYLIWVFAVLSMFRVAGN